MKRPATDYPLRRVTGEDSFAQPGGGYSFHDVLECGHKIRIDSGGRYGAQRFRKRRRCTKCAPVKQVLDKSPPMA